MANISKLLARLLVGAALTAAPAYAGKPASVYQPSDSPGQVRGVGTESQDIISMSDTMVRDMLTVPELLNARTPPRVIIDAKNLHNESTEILDKALITDRILVGLNRAAGGRVVFLSRENLDAIQGERDLKDHGLVDSGTTGRTRAIAGGDYALVGRIGTRDAVDPSNGTKSRYSQYTFKLIDLEYGTVIWSNIYEFKKEASDSVVYR